MPPDSPRHLPELGDFLTALRVNGVPIGPADIARLRQLFALEPSLDRSGLHDLLSALLVKTPAQREVFEALFADWCPDHDADWPEEEVQTRDAGSLAADTSGTPQPHPPAQERDEATTLRQWPHRAAALLLVVLLGAVLIWWWWPAQVVIEQREVEPISTRLCSNAGDTGPDDLPAIPVDKAWFWRVRSTRRPYRDPGVSARSN